MKNKNERERIRQKIGDRKLFQSETWEYYDYILEVLAENGFDKSSSMDINLLKAEGGVYYFQNRDQQKVSLLVSDFLGKFIQVEFLNNL